MRILQNLSPKIFLKVIFILAAMFFYRGINFTQNSVSYRFDENAASQQINLNVPFQPCWVFPFPTNILNNIASDNESLIYTPFLEGTLAAINSELGTLIWQTDLGGQIASDLLISGENLYVISNINQQANSENNEEKNSSGNIIEKNSEKDSEIKNKGEESPKHTATLRAIHKFTGITNWESKISVSGKNSLYEYSDSLIVVDWEGLVSRIEKQSGRLIWQIRLESRLSAAPNLELNNLIIGLANNQIISISLDSGSILTAAKLSFEPTALLGAKNNSKFIWGDRKGIVTSAQWTNARANRLKTIWKFRIGAEISHIVSTPNGLLISSLDNFVYMLSEKSGKIIWKQRFAGRISYKPLVIGDFAVISVFAEREAFAVETNTGRLINKFSLSEDNFFTESPLKIKNRLFFPTLKGLFSFSQNGCPETSKIKTD